MSQKEKEKLQKQIEEVLCLKNSKGLEEFNANLVLMSHNLESLIQLGNDVPKADYVWKQLSEE